MWHWKKTKKQTDFLFWANCIFFFLGRHFAAGRNKKKPCKILKFLRLLKLLETRSVSRIIKKTKKERGRVGFLTNYRLGPSKKNLCFFYQEFFLPGKGEILHFWEEKKTWLITRMAAVGGKKQPPFNGVYKCSDTLSLAIIIPGASFPTFRRENKKLFTFQWRQKKRQEEEQALLKEGFF